MDSTIINTALVLTGLTTAVYLMLRGLIRLPKESNQYFSDHITDHGSGIFNEKN